MPSLPELREPLTDGMVTVRAAAERDIPEVLIAYQDDPALHLRMGHARPPSGAELGRRAEQADIDRIAGRALTLTMLEPGEDACQGQIGVHHVDWDSARAELEIWVAPQLRGRGIASRALALAVPWLLREAGLLRVAILPEADNEPMIRAAQAVGFTHEGVLRGYTRTQGRRVDHAVLSMVARDLRG